MDAVQQIREEPTLGVLLRSVAYTRMPTQFYQLLQLAVPLAAQFWSYGLRRTAGAMIVVSLFGIWALCVKRIDEVDDDSRARWPRVGRRIAAGLGGALAAGLVLEGFVQVMSHLFHCPGCAG